VQTHGVAVRRLFGPLQGDRPWLGLILSASLLAVVGLTRYFVGRVSAGFEPIAFLPAILLAGLFGGIRIGLAIFAISMLGAWVWFFPPYGTFVLASRDAITFAVFVLTAALEVCVIRILNLAINDLTLERDRSNILFHELQHRVANNLQFAAAVLYTEKKTLSSDTAAAGALDAAESRLMLMSRVHRMLHDPASVNVPIERHLEDLCRDIIQASALPHIHLRVQAAPIRLPLASLMSLSLIVAELVTNSLKHAFGGRTNGAVTIVLETKKKTCILTVADDGGGVTIGAGDPKADGLGQGILRSLASQLLGTISFESNKGTTARVVFPFEK
jgi:two-component sensor histidine kinase